MGQNGSKSVQNNQRFQEVNEPLITLQEYSHVFGIQEEEVHHVPSATELFPEICQEIDIPFTKDTVEEKAPVSTISDANSKENGSSLQPSVWTTVANSLNINPLTRASDSSEIMRGSYAGVVAGRNSIERKQTETEGDKQKKVIKQVKEKNDEVKRKGKWMKDYCSSHKILLVGEGDFSFSACLTKAFGSATNMVATSLDSLAFLEENYPSSKSHIGYLKKRGCTVLHELDATKMAGNPYVNNLIYDRIVFNFPLAGFFNESKKIQLKRNRKLVKSFLKNANRLIADDGEVHIRHKSSSFYREWKLENLASQSGFNLIEDVEFRLSHYPGYHNKCGFGGNENFNCYPSSTYKFVLERRRVEPLLSEYA